MAAASLTLQISFWVRINLRGEEVAEYVDEKWRDCLKGVKAFKSNWTKAVNHSGISLEEQVDLIQELLQRDYVFGLADWEGFLKNQLVALKEIVQRVEIAKATPVWS